MFGIPRALAGGGCQISNYFREDLQTVMREGIFLFFHFQRRLFLQKSP